MAMATQHTSAAQAIGEYLQSPDDLVKVAAFRKKLEKEKASIDARLKSGVKEQLDATREGLQKLLSTRNNVQLIKEEMQAVDRMCTDPQHEVSTFDQISRVRKPLFSDLTSETLHIRSPWSIAISSRPKKWSTTF